MYLRLPLDEYKVLCRAVLDRDHWQCRNCKIRSQLHVHHIIFRSLGGDDSMENLITLCSSCHDGVHTDISETGQMGLTVVVPCNANENVQFIWAEGWRP